MQICETPWKFEELKKEKEAAEAAAAATAAAAEKAVAAASEKQAAAEKEGSILAAEVRRLQHALEEAKIELKVRQVICSN